MVSINLNIQKKDLWLLSAIMVFLMGVGFVVAWTYPGQTADPSVHGHTANEIQGGAGGGLLFGEWQNTDIGQIGSTGANLVEDNVYQAATDGFVIAYSTTLVASESLIGYTGSSSDPPAKIYEVVDWGGERPRVSITMPVKKDDYWKVTCSDSVASLYWIPILSGTGAGGSPVNCVWTAWSVCAAGGSASVTCPLGFVNGYERIGCRTSGCDDITRCERVRLNCCEIG